MNRRKFLRIGRDAALVATAATVVPGVVEAKPTTHHDLNSHELRVLYNILAGNDQGLDITLKQAVQEGVQIDLDKPIGWRWVEDKSGKTVKDTSEFSLSNLPMALGRVKAAELLQNFAADHPNPKYCSDGKVKVFGSVTNITPTMVSALKSRTDEGAVQIMLAHLDYPHITRDMKIDLRSQLEPLMRDDKKLWREKGAEILDASLKDPETGKFMMDPNHGASGRLMENVFNTQDPADCKQVVRGYRTPFQR